MFPLTATDAGVHYLVLENQGGQPIYVFVGRDPAADGGPAGEPAAMELLPGLARFGALGRPVLGQHPSGALRFREFPSAAARDAAGYVPVPNFRLCDTWADYHSPWDGPPADPTLAAAADASR